MALAPGKTVFLCKPVVGELSMVCFPRRGTLSNSWCFGVFCWDNSPWNQHGSGVHPAIWSSEHLGSEDQMLFFATRTLRSGLLALLLGAMFATHGAFRASRLESGGVVSAFDASPGSEMLISACRSRADRRAPVGAWGTGSTERANGTLPR